MYNNIFIQIYSDIHLELLDKLPDIKPLTKYLFLAGDISNIKDPKFIPFLNFCSKNWEKTYYIPGNCEYYSEKQNFNELEFNYKYLFETKYKNVFYLNDNFISLNEDINIYGTTLWTKSPLSYYQDTRNFYEIKDYNNIHYWCSERKQNYLINPNFINNISNKQFCLLNNYLNTNNKKTIIITHFPPINKNTTHISLENKSKCIKDYYSWENVFNNISNKDNILTWISGHTHLSYDFIHNDTNIRLISNQLGYISDCSNSKFKENGLYSISY